MNEIVTGAFAHKLEPLRGERFEAFAIQDMKWHDGKPRRLDVGEPESFDDAVYQAAIKCPHKTVFFIKRTDVFTGAVTLHFFVIKARSKPVQVRRPGFAHTVQQRPHYAEALFDLALEGIG